MKRLASSLILACLALAGATAIEAKVVSVSGKAERQKGSEWVALAAGDVLKAGAVVQTGFKSQVVLNIKSANEDSTVTVSQLSRMTIEQLSEKGNQDTTSLFLDSGSLKSNIKKTEDRRANYQVRTSVATASVRGTVIKTSMGYRNMTMETSDGTGLFIAGNNQKPVILSNDTEDVAPAEIASAIGSGESSAESGGAMPPTTSKTDSWTPPTTTASIQNSFGKIPRGAIAVRAGQAANIVAGGNISSPNTISASQALAFKTTANSGPVAELVHTAEVPPASSFTHSSVQDGAMPSGNGGGSETPTGSSSSGSSSGGGSSPSPTPAPAATSGGININVGNWH